MRPVSSVLITGTTSGVGRALLEEYVARGVKVIAVNRRRLPELELRHPSVRFECVDVRSAADVEALVRRLAASGELPEVFILNAGINRIDNDDTFDLAHYREVVDTNLYGVLNFIGPLTQLPPSGVARHLVAISSMVSLAGNAYALGYQTSKQSLTSCFDLWSQMYAGTDLIFQQVLLGPVQTGIFTMEARLPRWMVRIRDAATASLPATVRAIARFAETRRKKLIHPWRALPVFVALRLVRRVFPGFLQGRRTLQGKRRRAGPQ